MKLPNIPFIKKNASSEYLLVLLLRQEKANAVIVEKDKSTLRVLNKHEEFFSSDLENATSEEWLDILDTSISRAEEKLPPNIETHQTIFGIPNSWVEDKQIKKEYLSKLKKASDELDLKPIGFIEIPEAISHLIEQKEGAPVSALIAEIGKKHVSVSLSKAGNILKTKTAVIHTSPVETVDTVLKTFTEFEILPPRLIIYNGNNVDELTQSFITHRWSKSIPFVHHVPQVSVLEKEFDVNAVVAGAAEQLGLTLVGSSETQATIKTLETNTLPEPMDEASNQQDEEFTPKVTGTEATAQSFGFVIGKDINELSKEELPSEDESNPDETPDEFSSDNLSDVDQNVLHHETDDTQNDEPLYAAQPSEMSDTPTNHADDEESNRDNQNERSSKLLGFLPVALLEKIRTLFSKLPTNNKIKHKAFLFVPLFLIILIVLGVIYTSMVKATIDVRVRPEVVEKEEDVVFITSGSSDYTDNILQAKTTTIKVSGEVKTNTTGEEETGEKAKGTVTLFNSATSKKELAEGTIITSSNDLDFVIDKEVIIASASGDIFSGIQSGTAKVPVTASKIGKEYNIPSNTTFTVSGDSNVAAKNDDAFSGGTKEEIRVVSANDIAKLTKDLPNSLKQKAEDELSDNLGKQEILLTVYADFSPSASDFSNTEGQEASTVTLSSEVEFVGIFYDNTELVEYTKTLIKDDFSQDLELDESGIRTSVTDFEEDDGEYSATLSIEADLLPKIDTDTLKKEFEGRSFEDVNSQFDKLPQVITTTITLFPPIPFLPQIMPRKSDNIDIVISSNE